MPSRISVERIEFHNSGASYNYRGSRGYSIPESGGIAIIFQVNEADGSYSQFTEVLQGPFSSYDDAVDAGYSALERRLSGFAKTAEGLKEHREKIAAQREGEREA